MKVALQFALSIGVGIVIFALNAPFAPLESRGFSLMSTSTVIEHIVLLKVKKDTSAEDIKNLIEGTKSLRTIPGVISITVGPTFAEEWMPDRRNGHTHTLSCRLQNKEALRVYQDHPLHDKVKKECLLPLLVEPPMAVDYESVVVLGDNISEN